MSCAFVLRLSSIFDQLEPHEWESQTRLQVGTGIDHSQNPPCCSTLQVVRALFKPGANESLAAILSSNRDFGFASTLLEKSRENCSKVSLVNVWEVDAQVD